MKDNKKLFSLLILILLILIAGTSFAIYKVLLEPTNSQDAIIPKIKVSYIEPDYKVSSTRMSDEEGKSQNNYYEFTLTNETQGNIKLNYYIFLNKINESNIDSKYIKVYLTDENNNPVGRFKDSSSSLYLNYLDSKNKENLTNVVDEQCMNINNNQVKDCDTNNTIENNLTYRLRFWISDEFDINPTITDKDKTHTSETPEYIYKFKVNILISE